MGKLSGYRWVIPLALLSLASSSCASSSQPLVKAKPIRVPTLPQLLAFKLQKPVIHPEISEQVDSWIEHFSKTGAKHFRRYLERSGRYIPLMQEILQSHSLPNDLVYIALIESGFNPHARSRADAVGPWQFIASTGRRYGLRIDSWVDERRDPVKSTHAAARYLKDLYDEFHDWNLAMAAYNAGEGSVRGAIDESGSRDFWVHADPRENYLTAETRDYVPKYIAAKIIAKAPGKYGFGDIAYQRPHAYETVEIPSQTDLGVIATCAGVPLADIEELNHALKRGTTPPGAINYEIRIPNGKKEAFLVAYNNISKEERTGQAVYRVKKKGRPLALNDAYVAVVAKPARPRKKKTTPSAGKELVIKKDGNNARTPVASHEPRGSDDIARKKQKGRPLALGSLNQQSIVKTEKR